ncbi:hypothetical protein L1987_64936 [Smallanthus sonchifolius]|uniref:Uncharacterized protein n=1 Tax=Smallanthus sonchifolius TaxID=185202 RepID=A0ACB9BT33_9ASTR|nr:hypothetical protein L1987_64936 [Smallanthus sonchifolius]
MAAPKRWIVFCITLILLASVSSETVHDDYEAQQSDDSSLKIKHEQLLSKVLNLESSIDERSREINSKDERIKQLELVVLEKSNSLTSLHSEIQSLQKKESFYTKELEGEAHAQASELVKQVENLKAEISKQNTRKEALEARINVAEKKIAELNVKLVKLQKINEEQKIRIRNTEHALEKAQEERIRIQLNAARYSKELTEVHESWLPSWLAVHLVHYQSVLVTHWNVYGRPALDVTAQKALETQAQVRKWARPHIDAFHTKWIPTIKDQWLTFVTDMEPYVQILTSKTVEIYNELKKTLRPHITSIQTILDPYIKEAKKLTMPYLNQLSKTLRPHINKARVFLKPYTKKILRVYRRFSKTTLKYHRQVRANISKILKENEFTRPLARDEVVWFMASAFMVFPVMILLTWLSSLFSKKPRRRTRTSHTSHSRRRAKRVHLEKASTSR